MKTAFGSTPAMYFKMAYLHIGEPVASMAGIGVSGTPYKLLYDYFWL